MNEGIALMSNGEAVESLVSSLRIQTDLLIHLSGVVLIGSFATIARYYLPTGARAEKNPIPPVSIWWLFGAVVASTLSIAVGYVAHTAITGRYQLVVARATQQDLALDPVVSTIVLQLFPACLHPPRDGWLLGGCLRPGGGALFAADSEGTWCRLPWP